jgi:hypothetical protein
MQGLYIQGGSNMTGTDFFLNHNFKPFFLNHNFKPFFLNHNCQSVPVIFEPRCMSALCSQINTLSETGGKYAYHLPS